MNEERPFDLTPSLLKAIHDHKYFLSDRAGHEVSLEEAAGDFLRQYAPAWRQVKCRQDARQQLAEIEKHKYLRSEKEGHDIGSTTAAVDWIERFAAAWRDAAESLEQNGFLHLGVRLTNPRGVHMRPGAELADIARRFDAEIYVHKPGMEFFNFQLNGRPWVSAKSILATLSMGIRLGDELEFIATGRHAREVLEAVAEAVNGPRGGETPLALRESGAGTDDRICTSTRNEGETP